MIMDATGLDLIINFFIELLFAALIMYAVITAVAILLWIILCNGISKFFKKAGVDSLKAFIPYYNDLVIIQIAGYSPLLYIVVFISDIIVTRGFTLLKYSYLDSFKYLFLLCVLIRLLTNFIVYYTINKKIHRGPLWVLCGVLFGQLAASIAGYSKNTVFDIEDKTNENVVTSQNVEVLSINQPEYIQNNGLINDSINQETNQYNKTQFHEQNNSNNNQKEN